MADLVSLEELKTHLNIDADWHGEDALLSGYLAAAAASVESEAGRPLTELPEGGQAIARQAILLTAGDYYMQRENVIVGPGVHVLPRGVDRLILQLRRF